MICWMSDQSTLQTRQKLAIKHTTRVARALITDIAYKVDVTSLHRDESVSSLGLNDIGRVVTAYDGAAVLRRVPA